jgi:hypothetical protein
MDARGKVGRSVYSNEQSHQQSLYSRPCIPVLPPSWRCGIRMSSRREIPTVLRYRWCVGIRPTVNGSACGADEAPGRDAPRSSLLCWAMLTGSAAHLSLEVLGASSQPTSSARSPQVGDQLHPHLLQRLPPPSPPIARASLRAYKSKTDKVVLLELFQPSSLAHSPSTRRCSRSNYPLALPRTTGYPIHRALPRPPSSSLLSASVNRRSFIVPACVSFVA